MRITLIQGDKLRYFRSIFNKTVNTQLGDARLWTEYLTSGSEDLVNWEDICSAAIDPKGDYRIPPRSSVLAINEAHQPRSQEERQTESWEGGADCSANSKAEYGLLCELRDGEGAGKFYMQGYKVRQYMHLEAPN